MKRIIVGMVAVAMVGVSHADIYANMQVGFGVGGNGDSGGIVDSTLGTEIILQVISGGGDGLNYAEAGKVQYNSGFLVAGNDVLLTTISGFVSNAAGSDFSDFATAVNGIITELDSIDTWVRVSGVADGNWVFEQAISFASLDSTDPFVTPETIFYDNAGAGGSADGSVQVQVIPEPGTLGLMGIAGLGMFLARKKARR